MKKVAGIPLLALLLALGVSSIPTPVAGEELRRLDRMAAQSNDGLATHEPSRAFGAVARFLELDPYQADALARLLAERQENLAPVIGEIARRQHALDRLLQSAEPDPAAVGALILQIRTLNSGVEQIQEAFRNAFASLLDEDQRARLAKVVFADSVQPILPAFAELGLI